MSSLVKTSKWLTPLVLLAAAGCAEFKLLPPGVGFGRIPGFGALKARSQSPEDDELFETSLNVPMVGDYTTVTGLHLIALQGVGLVTGLDGTGSDPPPSTFRTRLIHEMRRRGFQDPNAILRSPSTALVVVQAYLPPLIRKGERFDIEVRVPGSDETTSLNGGWLMPTLLSEHAVVPGRGELEGHIFAKATGPVLVSTGEGIDESQVALLRRGRVLGGGISLKSRNLALYLRNDFRMTRNSVRMADAIGNRFSGYDKYGIKRPLAKPLTDVKIELIVPDHYRDNYPRYLQVVRNIAFREDDVARRVRMRKLKDRLLVPESSERAALQLEAIGAQAIPLLRNGLDSRSLEVRFHSAVALAYLGEADGVETLAEAARKEPAFRVFALAALAASDHAEASLALRQLLNEKSAETRYGAWRALTTMDRGDPLVQDEAISDEFQFHVLDTDGPPLIHLTNRKKAEIVLFGRGQRFRTPLALRAGNHILVTAPQGSRTVTVSRFKIGEPDRRKTVANDVADVIRTVAELDATYPDIAQMLAQADRQQNVPGEIALDAVPQAGRIYYRPGATSETTQTNARIGRSGTPPNLFSRRVGDGPAEDDRKQSDRFGEINTEVGTSSAADIGGHEQEEPLDDEIIFVGENRKWWDVSRLWK